MWWLAHAQVLRSYEGRGTYEIKVDSALDGAQQFGLLFEHDPMNFMVFMLYAYPNDVVKAYIERFTYVGGQLRKTTFSAGTIGITVPDPGPYYLRVTVNDATDPAQREWQCEWSVDGAGWTKLFSGVYEGAGPEENIGSIASVAATSTVGIAPIFQTSAIDGRPAVRFDGVDDYLTMPAGFQDFTGGMLLFVVMRPTVLQQGFKIVALGNGPGQQDIVLGRAGSTSGFQYFTNDSNGGWGWFDTSGGLAVGEATVVSVMQQAGAANSSRQADLAVNGVSLQSGNVYVPPVTTRGLNYIGKSYCNEGMFQGDVAEIILYNRTLSAEEKAVVEDHLSQKYVLSLP